MGWLGTRQQPRILGGQVKKGDEDTRRQGKSNRYGAAVAVGSGVGVTGLGSTIAGCSPS